MIAKPKDVSTADWKALLKFLGDLPDEKLTQLYEATENLSETAQIKLLKKAAERVKGIQSTDVSKDHSTRQGEEGSEHTIKPLAKQKGRRTAGKHGTEMMEDAQ